MTLCDFSDFQGPVTLTLTLTLAHYSGQEKVVPKSKYQEDVYVNGHTSVYGSFFQQGRWGYKCCGALQKQAYCTGAASRSGADAPQQAAEPEPTNNVDRTRPLIEVRYSGIIS